MSTPLSDAQILDVLKSFEWSNDGLCPHCWADSRKKEPHMSTCDIAPAISTLQERVLETPSADKLGDNSPSEIVTTSNQEAANVALLKRLCEVDTRWRLVPVAECFWAITSEIAHCLKIWPDGRLDGGEALWWMLQEMKERWDTYPRDERGHIPCNAETDQLSNLLDWKASRLTASVVIESYIAWREALTSQENL